MAKEEAILRWLIARQPHSPKRSYPLPFLLMTNARDGQAMEDWLIIFKRAPDDRIGHMWRDTILQRWYRATGRMIPPSVSERPVYSLTSTC